MEAQYMTEVTPSRPWSRYSGSNKKFDQYICGGGGGGGISVYGSKENGAMSICFFLFFFFFCTNEETKLGFPYLEGDSTYE